ncbi:DNA polymerase III subunit gamma/tau [Microbacterium sp. LWH7-1.2]|uniref:DNA polymerase III subunit gamma/tau n=1 Tax=Microbacterium sp. LWH7-1.2 TaxID=3135257 RepID=UPI00313933C9
MTTGRDDDALTWDGDDDPTLDHGASGKPDDESETEAASTPVELPEGFTAVGRGSDTLVSADAPATTSAEVSSTEDPTNARRQPMGNVELVSLGVLGGIYALFAVGWLIGGLRLQARLFLDDPMFFASLWLAVLAPLLWFATVLLLTRGSRSWIRFVWLSAGAILLVPWPFLMLGAVAV